MPFNVCNFFPDPKPGQVISFQYDGPLTPRSDFYTRDGLLIQDDYHDGKWADQWQIYKHPVHGVMEVGDMERCDDGIEKFLFGERKQITYKLGKEIRWGYYQNVGDIFQHPIEVDRSRSTGLQSISPINLPSQYGWQTVYYESLQDDILQLTYFQWFGNRKDPYGARYWFKRDVGPIKVQWLMPDGNYTNPVTATITTNVA